jgi:hypothetical protein
MAEITQQAAQGRADIDVIIDDENVKGHDDVKT